MTDDRKKRFSRRTALAAGGCAAGAATLGALGFSALRRRARGSVILIVADALRADRIAKTVSVDGAAASLTPNCERLAREGVVFDNAFAASSWTPISVASMFYGASPLAVGYSGRLAVRTANASLASAFAERGFATAAVTANYVLDTKIIREGFADFVAMPQSEKVTEHAGLREAYKSAESVNEAVLAMADSLRRSERFFLYVHYMDTHEPYYCPGRFLRKLGLRLVEDACPTIIRKKLLAGERKLAAGMSIDEGVRQMEGQYDAAAMYWDEQMGELLDRLDDRGILDETTVIITSDHGEEFLDNVETTPNVGHARNLSIPEIHSPLVLWRKDVGSSGESSAGAPLSQNRAVYAAVRAHLADASFDAVLQSIEAIASDPILSALDWMDFDGFSLVDGNVKVNGGFDEEGRPDNLEAFQINRSAAPQKLLDVPNMLEYYISERLTRGGFESGDIDASEAAKLKTLGYFN